MLLVANVTITIVQTRPHPLATFKLYFPLDWDEAIVRLSVGLGRFVRQLISGLGELHKPAPTDCAFTNTNNTNDRLRRHQGFNLTIQ